MSKNTRWALAIVGVAIIIVAAVVIGTGKDDTDATQSPGDNTPAATGSTGSANSGPTGATSKGGGSTTSTGSGGATAGTGGSQSGGASPPKETGGASPQGVVTSPVLVAGKTRTIKVDKGDTVVIRGKANVSGEMHLHGYDKEVPLQAGKVVTIRVKTNIDGEFPIEFHLPGGESQVGTLQVNP